jgi:homoserine O-acetyltransferase
MNSGLHPFLLIIILFCAVATAHGQGTLQYERLGNFSLENGQFINDCRAGYRTFGMLNPNKSNAAENALMDHKPRNWA